MYYTIIKKDLIHIDSTLAGCWEYEIVLTTKVKESFGTYKECKKLVKEYEQRDDELLRLFS